MSQFARICDITTVQLSNGIVHKFYNILLFMKKKKIFHYVYTYLPKMIVHAFMIEHDQPDDPRKIRTYVQCQWRVVLL